MCVAGVSMLFLCHCIISCICIALYPVYVSYRCHVIKKVADWLSQYLTLLPFSPNKVVFLYLLSFLNTVVISH